jgi:hypothetical protein
MPFALHMACNGKINKQEKLQQRVADEVNQVRIQGKMHCRHRKLNAQHRRLRQATLMLQTKKILMQVRKRT